MADETVKAAKKRYRQGAACPPYRCGDIAGIFREYENELAGKTFTDPLGVEVFFFDYNFTKLVQLQVISVSGERTKAKARKFLEELRAGRFEENRHAWDVNRSQTLFWIPDVIQDPDSIHRNCHGVVTGDMVYVKRYAKAGAPYKLVFTVMDRALRVRVVTTSFLVPTHRLELFIQIPPVWEKRRGHPCG